MRKQAMVVGLGQFGTALARSLTERNVEVLAIDLRPELVQQLSGEVAETLCFDAMDESALAGTAPERRDISICAIGPESREASIIVTALLRQMGAPHIVARSSDDLHARILRLVGAHDVVNPERDFGQRLATRLLFHGVIEELPLGEDLMITELHPPAAAVGHTLLELALPRRFEIMAVAVRRTDGQKSTVTLPDPREPLRADDILVVVSPPGAVGRFTERL